jgi:DNA repair photolyase
MAILYILQQHNFHEFNFYEMTPSSLSLYQNSLSVTSQFSFCGLPFRLDTYSGCSFNCTYCFARLRGGNINTKNLKSANPDYIITRFKNAFENNYQNPGIILEYIKKQMPVHFGGMSDPFQPIEARNRVSLRVLKYLCSIQYPIVISTKSDIVSEEPYLSVLKSNSKILVQFSLSTTIDKLAEIVEPSATLPSKLFKTIEKLSANNINTSIRWQPFIPNVSESSRVFVPAVTSLGIKHIGFEHLKLPLEKTNPIYNKIKNHLKFDIREYYKNKLSLQDGRELILPANEKLDTIKMVREETHRNNLTFGVADNEFQYLSDTDCCCSGVDQFQGFENWNKFQIAYAIKKSKGKSITFDLIKDEWRPMGAIDMFLNSRTRIRRNKSHNTVFDYISNRWQDIYSSFNPIAFYGIRLSSNKDDLGYRIYKWSNANQLKVL